MCFFGPGYLCLMAMAVIYPDRAREGCRPPWHTGTGTRRNAVDIFLISKMSSVTR